MKVAAFLPLGDFIQVNLGQSQGDLDTHNYVSIALLCITAPLLWEMHTELYLRKHKNKFITRLQWFEVIWYP